MPYRYTEEDLADIRKRQDANLSNFQRNSGRGLPEKTVKEMEKGDGIRRDEHGAPVPAKVARAKYANVPTEVDGIRFDSKLEAKYYVELDLRRKAGDVMYFLRQVPFHLPGGVIYRVDFMVVSRSTYDRTPGYDTADSDVDPIRPPLDISYIDCKGWDTAAGKNKIKMVEALYRVKIELVRKVKTHRKL